MHLPDGFLGDGPSFGLIAVAVAALSVAVNRAKKSFFARVKVLQQKFATESNIGSFDVSVQTRLTKYGQSQIAKMAVIGSFVFATQMINLPVLPGVSGHLIGGVLAAAVLGPSLGLIVIASVLIVQSVFFADGGLLALGANIINMGLVGSVFGYWLAFYLRKTFKSKRGFSIAIFMASWCVVVVAALLASIEISLSGTASLKEIIPPMLKSHVLIGLLEAVITTVVLLLLKKQGMKLHFFLKKKDEL
ncbi:MAG: energy-coupling factor ABC transporter permease [bacterium]